MASAPLQLLLDTTQIVSVTLHLDAITDPQLLREIKEAQRRGEEAAEIENRNYHMGTKPTSTASYDDRLTVRLNCSSKTAYVHLAKTAEQGGLGHRRLGKKYLITERAVRRFEAKSGGPSSSHCTDIGKNRLPRRVR
ncbi:hypothetical protein GCM10023172_23190 [Hymenobacter ginsengisoli]|uniref:Helix-turn-helix domain-containing protein n=1 Tax=Hymenobacter ginsengisoli TaxID=1051626 RepID=A0ABP8QEZ3_9BACT